MFVPPPASISSIISFKYNPSPTFCAGTVTIELLLNTTSETISVGLSFFT